MKRLSFVFFAALIPFLGFSQRHTNLSANEWVDSVFKTLTKYYPNGEIQIIVDTSVMHDQIKVSAGGRVYMDLFANGNKKKQNILNVFFWDDEGSRTTFKEVKK